MEHRLLGRTGVRVSPLCLGTLNFGGGTEEPDAIRMVHAALDAGLNFVDTADVYHAGESERIVGKALAGRRDKVVLATKVHGRTGLGPNDQGNSRLHILRACEASLRRLGTDYIDLYQVHRPSPEIPADETLGALTDLVRAGKVRYIGCSTHPAWMVMEALAVSERLGLARYVSEQPPYNLLDRRIENELIPLAQRYGLAILPWAPLAQGVLAGRYPADGPLPADSRAVRQPGHANIYADRVTPRGLDVGRAFTALARAHGRTPGQLALLWCKDQPGVTSPIVGPRTEEQLAELLPVLDWRPLGRRAPRLRRAGAAGRRGDQLPQHRPLDEDADSHETGVHRHPRHREDHALLRRDGRPQAPGAERRHGQGGRAAVAAADQPQDVPRRPDLDPHDAGGGGDPVRQRARHRRVRPERPRQLRLHGAVVRPAEAHRAVRGPLDEVVRRPDQGAHDGAGRRKTACATPTSSSCGRSTSSSTPSSPRRRSRTAAWMPRAAPAGWRRR